MCVWGQSYCKLTMMHVCWALHVRTVYKKCTVCEWLCAYVCVASQSARLSECNGTALMDAHLSWSAQSVAEVQPSLASSPAWKPCNLLSTILALFSLPPHFPLFSLPVLLSLSNNLIFSSLLHWLSQLPLSPHCLPIKSLYPGSETGETQISSITDWLWTLLFFSFPSSLPCSEENEIREDDM